MDPKNALLHPVDTLTIHSRKAELDADVNLGKQMSQNVPKCPMSMPLSRRLQQAIRMLQSGHGETEVAAAVKVNRRTLHRWRTTHPEFIAETNRLRQFMWQGMNDHMLRMVGKALGIVDASMDGTDDGRELSFKVLQLLLRNGIPGSLTGPTHPMGALEQIAAQGLTPDGIDADPPPVPKLPPETGT